MTKARQRRFAWWIGLIGLCGGAAVLYGQDPPGAEGAKTPEQYGKFAMQFDGDASRGRGLYQDEDRAGCSKCHTIDGQGGKAGPDLASVGDQFARRDLIEAVLSPSARIAVGYSTTVVETKSGEEYQGVLKQVTNAGIELMGGDGQMIRLAAGDIQEQRGSRLSLMPEGLQAGLSEVEFTDLIQYLVTLKQPENAVSSHRGMPDIIPELAPPVLLRPLFRENLRVPMGAGGDPGNVQSGLVWFGQVPGLAGCFLAVDQAGIIWLVDQQGGGERITVFADLMGEVFSARGPNGLLGLAFHPGFRENRRYFLKHQVFEQGKIATVLVERRAAQDFRRDSGQASRRLLKIASRAEHHNGGCIEFGPDGFLYMGMGDSAPNFDPQGYGQDLGLHLGKMLRLDVDRRDGGRPYGIPADNPFLGCSDVRPEIWAYGFREPWRFSFDAVSGELWVADLGQERGDEVSIVRPGENHGWNIYEGFELFSLQHRREGVSYVPPIFASRRKHGSSVIGGRVYRGDKGSSFFGVYVFGDHQSKRIWGMTQKDRLLTGVRHLATCPQSVTSFGVDERGGMYVVGYQGMVYGLDFSGAHFDAPGGANEVGSFPVPSDVGDSGPGL